MRTVRSVSAVLVLMAFIVVGCATDTTTKAYQAIGMAGVTYDTGMKTVASLQKQGTITADQRATINKYATVYFVAYNVAVDALATYKATGSAADSVKLSTALTGMATALADLIAAANKYGPIFMAKEGAK